MPHTIVNPEGLHDPRPFGYSHSARVPAATEMVFVSGQYASDERGAVTSADFAGQVERAFENLATALGAHGLDLSHVVQLRSYVVEPDLARLGAIGSVVGARCGAEPPTQTVIGVASLATPEILFEVEAVAARP